MNDQTPTGLLRRQGMLAGGGGDKGGKKGGGNKGSGSGSGGGGGGNYLIAYLKNDYGTKLHELRHARYVTDLFGRLYRSSV